MHARGPEILHHAARLVHRTSLAEGIAAIERESRPVLHGDNGATLKATTVLLWAGPFLLLAIGILIGWRAVRARARIVRPQPLSSADRERAERLLGGEGDAR